MGKQSSDGSAEALPMPARRAPRPTRRAPWRCDLTSQTSLRPGSRSGAGAAGKPPRTRRSPTAALRQILPKSYLILVFLAIVIIGFIASPDFLNGRNAMNVITFSAIIAVLAVGQFFVILTGGIDLSVGSIVAMSTVVTAIELKHGE